MLNETREANNEYQRMLEHTYERGYKQGKKDTEKSINTYIQALDRAKILLRATWNLLQKQNETIYVLNMLEELVYYDNCECDGNCLMDDINYWFDEFCNEELDNK